jgi:hypothetical protein
MHRIKPKKNESPVKKTAADNSTADAADNNRINPSPESKSDERPSGSDADHVITDQSAQNKITNAEIAGPLDEIETEGV